VIVSVLALVGGILLSIGFPFLLPVIIPLLIIYGLALWKKRNKIQTLAMLRSEKQ
jgi:hypothetical protein